MANHVNVGDSVELKYIMYEDSCPEWVSYGEATVIEIVSQTSYSGTYRVVRDNGEEKTVDLENIRKL